MDVELKNQLEECFIKKKAIISFNVQNLDHLFILSQVSEEMQHPVMAQFSQKYISEFDRMIGLSHLTNHYQTKFLRFHLDHCVNENVITKCIDSGFTSVMFDGSSLPIKDNIRITNSIYRIAKEAGCLLEAELGSIQGIEDGVGKESGDIYSEEELIRFANDANYDMLALAIGNAHGNYISTDGINIKLLDQARKLIGPTHFVLHGGTGMPDHLIREAIEYGVVKLNVSTALKEETIKSMKEYVKNETEFNQLKYQGILMDSIGKFFKSFIEKFTI